MTRVIFLYLEPLSARGSRAKKRDPLPRRMGVDSRVLRRLPRGQASILLPFGPDHSQAAVLPRRPPSLFCKQKNDSGHLYGIWSAVALGRILSLGGAGRLKRVQEAKMGGGFGQQTGWIQIGDLAIAFVFPVPVAQTQEPDSEPVAA
jgi:hypothetical protein